MKTAKLCYKVNFTIIVGTFGHASSSSYLVTCTFNFCHSIGNFVHKVC